MTDPFELTFEITRQWDETLETKGRLAVYREITKWGSDQELEACLTEVSFLGSRSLANKIRSNRRPKPPSLT